MTDQSKFRAFEAATGAPVDPEFPVSSDADVKVACDAAARAFGPYRALPSDDRASFLEAIGEEILALGDALLERAALESGLPIARLTGERGRTISQLRMFADLVRSNRWRRVRVEAAEPDRQPLPKPDLRMRMIPLGPVAVFGASNFPLAFSTAGGDTASALAAGCPVIVKGHPAHPGTHQMVATAILSAAERTGMPAGVFGQVMGPGNDLGAALVSDPRITAVGFTGSRAGGLGLVALAQARRVPIPVYAEMSSVNPVIVLPHALASRSDVLGRAFVSSLTLGAGQFCTNPGVILVIDGEGVDEFERSSTFALRAQEAQTMLTDGICQAFSTATSLLAEDPDTSELATGLPGTGTTSAAPRLFRAYAKRVLQRPDLLNEVFGASSLIIRCEDVAELKALLMDMEGQLTVTLHLDDEDGELARELIPLLERKTGRILANGWPTGVEVAPAMVHGGPFPATSDSRTTSVGTLSIERFLRPVCYQDLPKGLLPKELQDSI